MRKQYPINMTHLVGEHYFSTHVILKGTVQIHPVALTGQYISEWAGSAHA